MTLQELKVRCEALASVGDRQAQATLELMKRNADLYEKNKSLAEANLKLHNENSTLKFHATGQAQAEELTRLRKAESNAAYILFKIGQTINLAMDMGIMPQTAAQVTTVATIANEMPSAVNKLEKCSEERVREFCKNTIRELERTTSGMESLKDTGLCPESEAIKETRRRLGLPETQDPAVTACVPTHAAGHYDKSDKMGRDLDGKKGD